MLRLSQEGRCYAVAFSPDSRQLAVGADTNLISLVDCASGEARSVIKGHTDYVRALVFSGGACRHATRAVASLLRMAAARFCRATDPALSSDGQRLISGGKDGRLYFFDVETAQPIMLIQRVGWTTAIELSKDGMQFVTSSQVRRGQPRVKGRRRGRRRLTRAVSVSPSHRQSKASGPVRTVNIFNIFNDRSSEMVMSINLGAAVTCLQFSPCGEYVVCGTKNKVIYVYDINRFKVRVAWASIQRQMAVPSELARIGCVPVSPGSLVLLALHFPLALFVISLALDFSLAPSMSPSAFCSHAFSLHTHIPIQLSLSLHTSPVPLLPPVRRGDKEAHQDGDRRGRISLRHVCQYRRRRPPGAV